MPVTTKKLPVSLSGRGEFVVPNPHERNSDAFLGIETGTEIETAAISYIGREVSAHDLADKFLSNCDSSVSNVTLVECFALYLRELQAFKIGNVLRIEYLPDGKFKLGRVANSPARRRSRKLPG